MSESYQLMQHNYLKFYMFVVNLLHSKLSEFSMICVLRLTHEKYVNYPLIFLNPRSKKD